MSRIVFFSIPAYGHTNPTVEVVRQLVRRGHRVRYYSFEEFRAKLEGAGAEFVPCDTFLPPAPRDLGRRMGHDFSSLMAMVIDVTVAMEEKTLRELGEFWPDCVVADSICVWGKLYARRLGLPLVCSTTTFAFDRETAREMRPGPLEVFYTLAGLLQIGKRLALLREHGYEVEKLTELIQNDSETDTIVYTSRAFQPGGEHFGERVAFVGPSLPELPPRTQRRERPLVYVSLGTVMHGNTGFYRACAEGLGDGPWDVLLSVGSPAGAETLGALPPNVRAEARVEQLRVLGEASVFLTHCGMNSVSESIWCGVPMVLAPQQSEEGAVARRAAELGAGLRLERRGPAAIRSAVEEVLAQREAYRRAIEPLAAGFRAAGGAARAAEKIEETIARKTEEARPYGPRLFCLQSLRMTEIHLGHQFLVDNSEHLFQLGALLRGETLPDALGHGMDVVVADVVVVLVFLGDLEVVLALVVGGLDLLHIALADQAVDLIGRVGRRDAHKGGELVDGWAAQGLDGLHGEGFYRGQAGLAVLKALEDLLIKMKLEFGIHDFKFLFQHAGAPALSYFFHFIKKRREGQSQIFGQGKGKLCRNGQLAAHGGFGLSDSYRALLL